MSFLTGLILVVGIIWFFGWLAERDKKSINAVKKTGKVIFGIILTGIVLISIIVIFTFAPEWRNNWEEKKVEMTVEHGEGICATPFKLNEYSKYDDLALKYDGWIGLPNSISPLKIPAILRVVIENNSNKTINLVKFEFVIHRKGHSTNLANWNSYRVDNIINPGEVYKRCWTYKLQPKYQTYSHPFNLEFEIGYTSITFAK